jgi:hypothetical protein
MPRMFLSLLFAATLFQSQDLLHPALVVDQALVDKCWQRGFDDAAHHRNPNDFINRYRKGLGDVRVTWAVHETVSWLWVNEPEIAYYRAGYKARRDFLPDKEVADLKDKISQAISGGRRHIFFDADLAILPSHGGLNQEIVRAADPEDLKDVRMVLLIDGKIYQPEKQPGDLNYVQEHHEETVEVPQFGASTTSGSVGGVGFSSTTTDYYTGYRFQSYEGYMAHFQVCFDLFDEDGTPRITHRTKEIEAIVVYGPTEKHIKFSMDDLLRAKENLPPIEDPDSNSGDGNGSGSGSDSGGGGR